jgi:hypothetical protein
MRKYVKDKDFKLEWYGSTGAGRKFEDGVKEYFGV